MVCQDFLSEPSSITSVVLDFSRQLRLSAETQMVLLALALPVVLASLLRSLGVEVPRPCGGLL